MMHNCIEGMEEPLYGFVTKLNIVESEECELDVTCSSNGTKIETDVEQNNLILYGDHVHRNSTHIWSHQYNQSVYNNIKRQTGEEFRSSGPPRCRIRRNPSNRCRTGFRG